MDKGYIIVTTLDSPEYDFPKHYITIADTLETAIKEVENMVEGQKHIEGDSVKSVERFGRECDVLWEKARVWCNNGLGNLNGPVLYGYEVVTSFLNHESVTYRCVYEVDRH